MNGSRKERSMAITVYGIPTCGTVKKARKWLDEHGVAYEWIDFRDSPPAKKKVAAWVKAFGWKPMRNTSGGAYRALPAEKKGWEETQWLPRLQADPMLLKRPVIEVDGTPVTVGFKEAAYEEIFGK